MSEDRDYLLGTGDAEVQRLGLQHRVWRPKVLDAWQRAGIGLGSVVLDAGAGPGWASLDLAETVGSTGRVHALERSSRFLEVLGANADGRGLRNIERHEIDLATDPLPVSGVDAFWVRWVLAFIKEPESVLEKLAGALRPGGVAVLHEYLDYDTFGLLPDNADILEFKRLVVEDWRASGGDPDAGRLLPTLLPKLGFRIRSLKAIVETVRPGDHAWAWTSSWGKTYPRRLVETGKADPAWCERTVAAFEAADRNPHAVMITPMVLEVIAEKVK